MNQGALVPWGVFPLRGQEDGVACEPSSQREIDEVKGTGDVSEAANE